MKARLRALSFAILVLCLPTARAAIAFDSTGQNTGYTNYNLDYLHTISSAPGAALIVFINTQAGCGDCVSGVDYNGVPLSRMVATPSSDGYSYVYFLAGATPGAHSVHVTYSNPYFFTTITSASYTGVSSMVPTNYTAITNTTFIFSASLTTVQDNSWVVLCVADPYSLQAGSGTTVRGAANFNSNVIADGGGPVHPAGPSTLSVSQGGGVVAYHAVIFELSPGTGTVSGVTAVRRAFLLQ